MTNNSKKEIENKKNKTLAQTKEKMIDASEEIWKINPITRKKGTWWWWFWLFFIETKNNQDNPEQLMVLWSTKNDPQITCNKKVLELDSTITVSEDKNVFKGAIAAWYFDGKEMHEDYILENCNMTLDANNRSLISDLNENTTFSEKDNKFTVKLKKDGKEFTFVSEPKELNGFSTPNYSQSNYFKGRFSHNIIRVPKIKFSGSVEYKNEKRKIIGTSYFQKVTVNAPASPWYWGIFHFEDGSVLSYFNPYIGTAILKENVPDYFLLPDKKVSLKKGMYFFNNTTKKTHLYKNFSIIEQKNKKNQPIFIINGKNENSTINFSLDCYSNAFWKFNKKTFGSINTSLKYNEYPAKITHFELTFDKEDKKIELKNLGKGIGNVEHSWGILI